MSAMGSLWRRLALVIVGVVAGMIALDGYLRSAHSAVRASEPVRSRTPEAELPAAPVDDAGLVSIPRWWARMSRVLAIERAGAERTTEMPGAVVQAGEDGSVYRWFSPLPSEVLLVDGPDLDAWTAVQRGVLLDTIELLLDEAGLPVAAIRLGPGLTGWTELLTRVRAPSGSRP